jgi:hypothetical protein
MERIKRAAARLLFRFPGSGIPEIFTGDAVSSRDAGFSFVVRRKAEYRDSIFIENKQQAASRFPSAGARVQHYMLYVSEPSLALTT